MMQVIFGSLTETQQDPIGSGTFRQFQSVENNWIRHPTTSDRNPVPRNPTSDRILSEVVESSVVSCRIRRLNCLS